MFLDKQPMGLADLLTVAEAAKLLGVSASGMRRLQQERRIPFFKVGALRCGSPKSDLAAYLARRRVDSIG
ncbi:MAG: helix-turn-helix domain-containing protein [Rhizomicrobium sp.]